MAVRHLGAAAPQASVPASVLSLRLEPLRQPAAQDRRDRAVADTDNPRAVDPPPAASIERRIPHAPREPPDPATGTPTTPTVAAGPPPATRARTARSSTPPEFRSCQPTSTSPARSSGPMRCTGYSGVAERKPPPLSSSIANSPRPRPVTRQRRSGVLLEQAIAAASLRSPTATPHRAHRAAPRPAPRSASSINSRGADGAPQCYRFALRSRGMFNGGRPGEPGTSMSERARTSAPQSGHAVGSGNRTSTANCVRQPRHSPITVSRRSGNIAGR